MIQKNSLYVIAIILISSLIFVWTPSSVAAVDSNVIDWVDEKQPSGEPDTVEKEGITELDNTQDKSFVLVIGQLIFYTLLILVMIYGLIKFLALKQKKMQPNQAVKLMGGTPLGNNKSLQLVKVGEQVYLIGVGDQVTLIKEFSSEDEINNIEKDLDKQQMHLSNSVTDFIKRKISNRTKSNYNSSFDQLFNLSLNKQKAKRDQLKRDLLKEEDDDDNKEGNPRW